MKIEFKNGSKIESIECFEGRAGHRKAVYFIGKPTLKTSQNIFKDLFRTTMKKLQEKENKHETKRCY